MFSSRLKMVVGIFVDLHIKTMEKQNSMTHSSKTNEDRYSETLLMRI